MRRVYSAPDTLIRESPEYRSGSRLTSESVAPAVRGRPARRRQAGSSRAGRSTSNHTRVPPSALPQRSASASTRYRPRPPGVVGSGRAGRGCEARPVSRSPRRARRRARAPRRGRSSRPRRCRRGRTLFVTISLASRRAVCATGASRLPAGSVSTAVAGDGRRVRRRRAGAGSARARARASPRARGPRGPRDRQRLAGGAEHEHRDVVARLRVAEDRLLDALAGGHRVEADPCRRAGARGRRRRASARRCVPR